MKEIVLTQGKVALVDDADFDWLNQWDWCANKVTNSWYAERRYKNKIVLMHRLITDAPKGILVDHQDRNGLNNQRYNLRFTNRSGNAANASLFQTNTSGYRGVTWDKSRNKWQVSLQANGKTIHLGRFSNLIDAARVHDAAALYYHGQFAFLNFPIDEK